MPSSLARKLAEALSRAYYMDHAEGERASIQASTEEIALMLDRAGLEQAALDQGSLAGFVKTYGATPFAVACQRDRYRAEVERLRGDLNTSMDTAAEFQRMVEADAVEIDRLRSTLKVRDSVCEHGTFEESCARCMRQRAEAAEHKLECAEIAEKTWREDHQRAIAIAQDAHVKLAEAQQREAWWREILDLSYDNGGTTQTQLRRYRELCRLLGLDAEREGGEK